MAASRLAAALRTMVRGRVTVNEPLKPLVTLQIGGPADLFAAPATETDLLTALAWAREQGLPCLILGAGSNLLVPDEGLRGLVLRTRPALVALRFEGTRVTVGSGVGVARMVGQATSRGLAGLEGLAGVPGSVGGALVMNAGTAAGSIGDRVQWVRVADETGQIRRLDPDQLAFRYRASALQAGGRLVLDTCLELTPAEPELIRARVEAILAHRQRTQPLQWPNAGSTFKNPPGAAAGWLIERAGCKGLRRGDAQISPQHANWVLNLGAARAVDVVDLMIAVRRAVWEQFGVALEPEIRLLGDLLARWQDGAVPYGPQAT